MTLFDQDFSRDQFEVVVVDDGSIDETVDVLGSLQTYNNLKVVALKENRGTSAAKNIGAVKARGEILLFLDDDMFCDCGLLSAHVAAHANEVTPKLVFGLIRNEALQPFRFSSQAIQVGFDQIFEGLESKGLQWPNHAWAGPNCSIKRTTFLEYGGYDEVHFARRCEDIELGMRLWKHGVKFQFERKAVAWHRWTKSDSQVWKDCEADGASYVALCHMYPELRYSWMGFGHLVSAPSWKRNVACLLTAAPWLTAMPLDVLISVFEAMPLLRRIGWRLYGVRRTIAALAGARRKAGSWRELVRLGDTTPLLS
jgi:GT2 family glycosyltransferase